MFVLRILAVCGVFFAAALLPVAGSAQTGSVVREIAVEGNQRIDESTVRSYLLIQEGDGFDTRRIDRSLKSLFATGLFSDVTIQRQGETLVVKLVENPVINRIAFEGNNAIEDDSLQSEITLRPRVVFTRAKVQRDVRRILDIYRVNGRFAATVEPKFITLPQNRADLVFEVDEGSETEVRKIRFLGNRGMSDSELRGVVRTKESVFYRFFSTDDIYDPDRLTLDRELLRRHYLREGYADFRVSSAVAELTPDRTAFHITFSVEEGKRYKFGEVKLNLSLRGLKKEQLEDLVVAETGDTYDNKAIDDTIEDVTDRISSLGFAFVEVRPRINRNREKRTIDVTFEVREGPRVFVERINISGNVRTLEKVIRREFRIVEGDAFNASKLHRSRRRIQNLNFFKKVEVERVAGSAPDKAVINVAVEEKSTGALNIGVGFSTDLGPLADISIRERNLLGKGQDLDLNLTIAAEKSQVSLAFTEPYFLDRDVSAGYDVFHTRRDLQDTSSHDITETGAAVRAGYPITDDLRQNFRYTLSTTSITNVASNASPLIKAQEGRVYLSQVSHSLFYDKRDSSILPTEGFFLRLQNDLAGFGGTLHFLQNQVRGGHFIPISDDLVLAIRGRVGHVFGLGEDIRLNDRFFLGGDTLRGFATAGVGPRDTITKDSLGGEIVYNGTVELQFPLGLPTEFRIKGKMFSDFGSVTSVNPSNANIVDSANIRASIGAGVAWGSPFGPISVDVGIPVLKESLDVTESFRVNFGTRF